MSVKDATEDISTLSQCRDSSHAVGYMAPCGPKLAPPGLSLAPSGVSQWILAIQRGPQRWCV